jgi:DNA-binding PadR family transcriptional regulator
MLKLIQGGAEGKMLKREWLLLVIKDSIEPIQIQKAMFKFAMESGGKADELYSFIPYNWGPCSMEIYDDLKQLREDDLIDFAPSGRGWNIYHLTKKGEKYSKTLRKSSNQKLLKRLDGARKYVVSRDFGKLLTDIYKDYPKYAQNSLFSV